MIKKHTLDEIKRNLRWGYIFIFFIFLTPIIVGSGIFIPEGESIINWVQRSGSIITIFSLFAYENSTKNDSLFNPIGIIGSNIIENNQKSLVKKNNILKYISFLLTMSGTLIWGYGDIIFNIFIS